MTRRETTEFANTPVRVHLLAATNVANKGPQRVKDKVGVRPCTTQAVREAVSQSSTAKATDVCGACRQVWQLAPPNHSPHLTQRDELARETQ